MAEAQQTERDPNALTPGELAYMESGGNTDGLVKEGLQVEEPAATPAAEPIAETKPAAAASAEPAAEPVVEDDDEAQPELDPKTGRPKKRGEWVSKKALEAERMERKRLSQELGAKSEQWARLEERFKVFQEAVTAPEPQAAEAEQPMPDPNQDIFGAFNWMVNRVGQLESRLTQTDSGVGEIRQLSAEQREQVQLTDNYRNDAARFAQQQPDFGAAYQFLMNSRDAELQAARYKDPAQRAQLIQADEQAIVRKAMQEGVSPAETVYALAKARGYAPTAPAAAAAAPAPAAAAANGAGNAAAAPKPSAAEEIARVKAGQDAALSLSNVGGNRPNNLTIMDLVNMPDHEFQTFARKNPQLLEQMAGK